MAEYGTPDPRRNTKQTKGKAQTPHAGHAVAPDTRRNTKQTKGKAWVENVAPRPASVPKDPVAAPVATNSFPPRHPANAPTPPAKKKSKK